MEEAPLSPIEQAILDLNRFNVVRGQWLERATRKIVANHGPGPLDTERLQSILRMSIWSRAGELKVARELATALIRKVEIVPRIAANKAAVESKRIERQKERARAAEEQRIAAAKAKASVAESILAAVRLRQEQSAEKRRQQEAKAALRAQSDADHALQMQERADRRAQNAEKAALRQHAKEVRQKALADAAARRAERDQKLAAIVAENSNIADMRALKQQILNDQRRAKKDAWNLISVQRRRENELAVSMGFIPTMDSGLSDGQRRRMRRTLAIRDRLAAGYSVAEVAAEFKARSFAVEKEAAACGLSEQEHLRAGVSKGLYVVVTGMRELGLSGDDVASRLGLSRKLIKKVMQVYGPPRHNLQRQLAKQPPVEVMLAPDFDWSTLAVSGPDENA